MKENCKTFGCDVDDEKLVLSSYVPMTSRVLFGTLSEKFFDNLESFIIDFCRTFMPWFGLKDLIENGSVFSRAF